MIAIPCMGTVPTDFMTSLLALRKPPGTDISVSVASLIYDSRNAFAARAISEGYDRVLFVDSDMTFKSDMLERLARDMDGDGTESKKLDYVSALFFNRQQPIRPMLYDRLQVITDGHGVTRADTHTLTDYPHDSLFTVKGTGFGCVLVSTRLLRSVWDNYGPPFMPTSCMGEDLAFCFRAGLLGVEMYCDSSVKVGHIGHVVFSEEGYDAGKKAESRKE